MGVTKQELRKYYKSIKKEMKCSFYLKNVFIKELKCNISDYIDNNPDAELSEIIDNFGNAKEISKGFLIEDNKKIIFKARIQICVIICLVILLLFSIYVIIDVIQESGGIIVDVTDK